MTLVSASVWRNGWSWEWTGRVHRSGGARSLFILSRAPGVAVAVYAAWHRDEWWRLRPAMERLLFFAADRAAKRYAKRPVQGRKVDP